MRKHLPQLCLWFVSCLAGVLPAAAAVAQPAEIIAVFDIDKLDTPIDDANDNPPKQLYVRAVGVCWV